MLKKMNKNKIQHLFEENQEAIRNYNVNFYPKLAGVGIVISMIAVLGSFIHPDLKEARFMYCIMGGICMVLYLFSKVEKLRKYALIWIYTEFVALYVLVFYLSVIVSPDRAAASILVLLTIVPITFIDRPERVISADVLMYLIHTVFAYMYKESSLGNLDMINCLVAVVVGCFCGVYVLETKLQNFNLARLLAYEKETDVLTTLGNRRKLVQTIFAIEKGEMAEPNGVMLFDIDFFKQYNDKFGHQAGDMCLRAFGMMLKEEEWGAKTTFYRYGGEEFVGFLWDVDEQTLAGVAEKIREKTSEIALQQGNITTSIGYVYCNDPSLTSYEKWIGRADKAVYVAKKRGRNCAVAYEENMERG